MEIYFWMILAVVAIDNAATISTRSDPLEWLRELLEWALPKRLRKIARCKLCQSLWMSLAMACLIILVGTPVWLKIVILWLAMHRLALVAGKAWDRMDNDVPKNLYVMLKPLSQDEPVLPDKPSKNE